MVPIAESIVAAPEVVPSLWGAALRVGIAIALIAAAGGAWLWWQRRPTGVARQLEVLDRAFLARGVSVALLRVGKRRLLIGISADGVRLIRDLEAGPLPVPEGRFADVLAEAAMGGEVKQ